MHRLAFVLLLVCLSVFVVAQTPTAGELSFQSGGTVPFGPYTYIDDVHPVSMDGSIDTLTTRWLTDAPCVDEIKIRFFRPGARGMAGDLTLVGAAGPFNTVNGLNTLTFAPIAVKKGDLLAITQLKTGCGGVTFNDAPSGEEVYEVSGDFNGGSLSASSVFVRDGSTLNAVASLGASRRVGTLPVAGSAPGNFGSFFRTEIAVTNGSPYTSTVKLVFHPAGTVGTESNPSLSFTLAPFATKSYTDVIQALGLTGLGSLDVYTTAFAPVVAARIYNDAGAAGTSGFTEDVVDPRHGLRASDFAFAPLPSDLTNYRVNVGLRTFGPVTIITSFHDANGTYIGNGPQKTYPANYFEQTSLAALAGNVAIPAGGTMQLSIVEGGPLVFYTSTNDNRTNDGSLKMYTLR